MSKKQSRAKVQAFGGFLTGMVIPNMGAFIAWGFITALFIPTGWFPNSYLAELVGPMITYLLPLLLAYTGGKMIYSTRGGVAASIATFGLIVGSSVPMFLGAMVMGPIGALIIKKFDESVEDHIPTGFEMVINNFSLGIIGLLVCLLSYVVIGPVIQAANGFVTVAIEALVSTGFLPLLSLINEPAKVLFLNNVIDQGIYYPLGMQQTLEAGKSIYFLVASNPGTGLGLLLAFFFFGNKASRENAPGAMIIHFIGGIHEIYFPYVLMKPLMIIPMILGGATGTLIFTITRVGLVAGPSPGSIISYLALTPKGNFFGIIAGVIGAGVVSFVVASFILKVRPQEEFENLEDSTAKAKAMKQEGKDLLASTMNSVLLPIKKIAFACDAGMGSSALGANAFKKQLKEINPNIEVKHFAIESVPSDFDVIVTHSSLLDRAKIKFPNKRIVVIEQFLKDPALSDLLEEIKKES
jgi:PTS system mannitol-specific IIC component